MLDELQRLHETVEITVAAQEQLLRSGSLPHADEIARSRWRIMSASRKRRDHLDAVIYPALIARLSGDAASVVDAVRTRDIAQRHWAREHLSKWPLEYALANFDAYLRAAEEVRFRIRAQLKIERDLLVPLCASLCEAERA